MGDLKIGGHSTPPGSSERRLGEDHSPVPRPTREAARSRNWAWLVRLIDSSTARERRALGPHFIAPAKAPCQAFARDERKVFSDSKTRTSLATGAHLFGELSGGANRFAPHQR
jgi:hypothetical protein